MKKTGRGAMWPTRFFRLGGNVWLEKSIVPAVMTSDVGISPHLLVPARLRSSRSEREPAPSATIAFRPSDSAAVCRSVSAPTERSEEHTSELQSHHDIVCRLLIEKKKAATTAHTGKKTKNNVLRAIQKKQTL